MAETLKVEKRENRGKRHAKRLRQSGSVPAVLYGHGEESISLSVRADQVAAALRHGSRMVDLSGDINESALIRELQWDTYGVDVLHVDFTRVSKDERIEVRVSVDLRGEAPGVRAGGVIEHLLHEVEIECLASAIPDKLHVNINHLELPGAITAKELTLPEGAKLLGVDADEVVVQCVEPTAEVETDADAGAGAEPEVIGRKAEAEEEA